MMLNRIPLSVPSQLKSISISTISLADKFCLHPAVHAIGNHYNVEKDVRHLSGSGCEGFFGNFSSPIPLFHVLILLDLIPSWDGTSRHTSSVKRMRTLRLESFQIRS